VTGSEDCDAVVSFIPQDIRVGEMNTKVIYILPQAFLEKFLKTAGSTWWCIPVIPALGK
jgi:hypothetical protein